MHYTSSMMKGTTVYSCLIGLVLLTTIITTKQYCEAESVFVGSTHYNLIPREDTRNTQENSSPTSESPVLISFDGDLDAIRQKALEKGTGGSRPPTSFTCENETASHLEVVNWLYTIETVQAANVATVYGEVSEITVDVVAPQTLKCYNNESAFANIIAMDNSIPGHEVSATETCEPEQDPSNKCTVVIGRMRMFLNTEDTIQEATDLVLKSVQQAYEDPAFVGLVNSGIVGIKFLSDDDDGNTGENVPPPIEDPDDPGNNEETEVSDSRLGLSSLLFVAVGSAALVVFVGSVYFWRRGRRDDEEGVHGSSASRFANMTVNDAASPDQGDKVDNNDAPRPASPYSEMVSNSYRLDRLQEMSILSSSNMSPVYEMDGQETDNDTVGGAASILISEGGYTTDAGGTEEGDSTMYESTTVSGSKFSAHSTPNILGARPFPGTVGNIDMEEISDSDLDTSGEMSPVKMYVGDAFKSSKLLVLPTGQDPMDEDNDDHEDSLLFGSPDPASKGNTDNNSGLVIQSVPTDEGGESTANSNNDSSDDVESGVGSMSLTSPMSQKSSPSF